MRSLDDTRLELTASATPEEVAPARNAVAGFASDAGAVPNAVEAVRLAVSEALTNVVHHAYIDAPPGAMIVEAWIADQALLVLISDEGSGMRPRPDTPGLGLGLPLIAQLADDFRVEDRGEGGTRVSLRFSLDGSGTDL